MLRSFTIAVAVVLAVGLAGCRQDMQNQPRMFPQRGSAFFADGRSVRSQVPGTVARGQEQTDSYFLTGMSNGKEGDGLPFPVTMQVLERGQERFNIYCSPCHSRVGNGEGRIVQRGYQQAPDFHSERLRAAPAGHFFNVITHGYGAMPDYHIELAPADRWAVVAYIRALQLSQNAKTADAPPGTHIVSLLEAASEEGLPTAFAEHSWMHPVSPQPIPAGDAQQSAETSAPSAPGAQAAGPQSQGKTTSAGETPAASDQQTEASAPPVPKPGDPVAGKEVYTQNCQMCHQPNRQGLPPAIPALQGIVAKIGAPHVRQTVMDGVPTGAMPMPSFASKLSSADIDNLIAFLKTAP